MKIELQKASNDITRLAKNRGPLWPWLLATTGRSSTIWRLGRIELAGVSSGVYIRLSSMSLQHFFWFARCLTVIDSGKQFLDVLAGFQ